MNRLIFTGILLTASSVAVAERSPWFTAPGTTTASFSYIFQSADEFYAGENQNELPDDLEQSTKAISLTHGLSDSVSLDLTTGYARSTFEPVAPREHIDGRIDSNIGVNWRVVDEYTSEGGWPSTVLRFGAIIEGNYEADAINAIGDGGSGYEMSLITGKVLNNWSALGGEVGYRNRNRGIPSETFFDAGVYLFPVSGLVASLNYSITNARGGVQLTDADFTPRRFPDLEEDNQIIKVGLSYNLTERFSAGVSAASVVDGRNTADSDAYSLTLSFTH